MCHDLDWYRPEIVFRAFCMDSGLCAKTGSHLRIEAHRFGRSLSLYGPGVVGC